MGKKYDLTGKVFGRWTILYKRGRASDGATLWYCRCACGNTRRVVTTNLVRGVSTSCGCSLITHGMTGTPTYSSWQAMKKRCFDANCKEWRYYGGRGITVCQRWLKFENFLEDMGERPEGMTLDRYPDNDGDYRPGNCRWATAEMQRINQGHTPPLGLYKYGRFLRPVSWWAARRGMALRDVERRLRSGETLERILFGVPCHV